MLVDYALTLPQIPMMYFPASKAGYNHYAGVEIHANSDAEAVIKFLDYLNLLHARDYFDYSDYESDVRCDEDASNRTDDSIRTEVMHHIIRDYMDNDIVWLRKAPVNAKVVL